MNNAKLKSFAPKARTDLLLAITNRAQKLGITAEGCSDILVQGDTALIEGVPYPLKFGQMREALRKRVEEQGFKHVIDAAAYTWFNRLMALRFMEVHGYLDHGFAVLSDPEDPSNPNALPQILREAKNVELPGVDASTVVELMLDGNKDAELYNLLLKGQCRALHQAMPFLFEAIDDDTELLLPENLLHSGSVVRGLVNDIDLDDWQSVEVVGWLYQFYISEKKDEVIGKVVKSEDIPAATQLFTPNWIVKYMVQNSLGAQWLATYPDSPLKAQMEYYIEPAEQTDEVNAQLAAITPDALNPEELTLIDPASGSGHILVEAYELFKAIYLERGYRRKDIPQLILEKNLFGLDIDERAAQLTGFALMMKGRADDRRLFERGVKLNVMALVDSAGFDAEGLAKGVELSNYGLKPGDLTELKGLFEHATTFGSLIQVPEGLAEKLPVLKQLSEVESFDLLASSALKKLRPLVQQAELLTTQYDAVVANPPYMGSKGMNALLKDFAKSHFPDAKTDLFTCFIERGFMLAKDAGYNAMVTMQSWMFLSSFKKMRERLLRERTIRTMVHMSNGVMGIAFGTAATILRNLDIPGFIADYSHISVDELNDHGVPSNFPTPNERLKTVSSDEFGKIPGSPVAYWASDTIRTIFEQSEPLRSIAPPKHGMSTGNNDRFLRRWSEISWVDIKTDASSQEEAAQSGLRWFPYNKGGKYRKWFGNNEFVIDYQNRGQRMRKQFTDGTNTGFRHDNPDFYFLPSVTWSFVSSAYFGVRYSDAGAVFDVGGSSAFLSELDYLWVTGFLCSKQVFGFMKVMNPTLNFQVGNVASLPVLHQRLRDRKGRIESVVRTLIESTRTDWNAYERSWDFQTLPLLTASSDPTPALESSYTAWITQNRDTIAEMKQLEETNNKLFIDAYGLADELTPDVPLSQITLTVNPAYRYGGKLTEEELWTRFRADTMEELVSYAIGCMMGRYSLDVPGLIYAHSGNEGFDHGKYTTFTADDDGIVPLTDTEWFDDDATNRMEEFLSVAWSKEYLEENLKFMAANLSPKKGESPRETLRRYISTGFFKSHLKTYKKRPIYWLFSSGKERAFEGLVYLHRYNEGTLARMRTEYVIPLQGKLKARIAHLTQEEEAETSTAGKKKFAKEKKTMEKKQVELATFEAKLRHFADKQISLDLDDGVKVNYGKFGDLLANVKDVTGKKPEVIG